MDYRKALRIYYTKMVESVAFYPALIVLLFLLISWTMLEIDFSSSGKDLKSGLSWLSLKDATTARSIIATVAGAVISLTVFSFSMVMIVVNQAASQMSNRVISSMLGNRFQQIILGIYIGTIVYSLFLLSTIRDLTSGINIPALSIYVLLLITIIDIFLFIYFLEYVTRSVKYETVIERVREHTMKTMRKSFKTKQNNSCDFGDTLPTEIRAEKSGYFQSVDEKNLLDIAKNHDVQIRFLFQKSTYLLEGTPYILVYGKLIENNVIAEIRSCSYFYNGQPIDKNPDYGFRQLAEVAIKALSPGVNDPATAVISLQALADVLAYRLNCYFPANLEDANGAKRIFIPASSFAEIFKKCYFPIWNYGKDDQYVREELETLTKQLKLRNIEKENDLLFDELLSEIKTYRP